MTKLAVAEAQQNMYAAKQKYKAQIKEPKYRKER